MTKSLKRINKERETIEGFKEKFEQLERLGIKYDRSLCVAAHGYVVHVWVNVDKRCNLFMKSLKFVPFGYHKGISGQGLEELNYFLRHWEEFISPDKQEYSYKDKFEALKKVLLAVRDERNFDLIDKVLEEYG